MSKADYGIIRGEGVIIRKDTGERVPITLTSDLLTKEQAEQLLGEGQDNGSNTSNSGA